jgi:hypothetical protein
MRSMCRENSASFPSEVGVGNRDTLVFEIPRCGWFDQADFTKSTLPELLEDPVIRRLMTSDGADPGELRALLGDLLSARLARDEASPREAGRDGCISVFPDRVLSR